ncbi:MAG TPA: 6-pyruvoyl-tetrahydropterin synthase-related protein, partial [Polyangia bacterium]
WLPDINGGHGYPTFVFYQPLVFFLWLPVRLVTGEAVAAMWGTIAIILTLGASAGYRLGASRGDRVLGLFGGALFLLAPYVYVNLLTRGDLSELLAMALVPWALWFLQLADDRWQARRPVVAPLAGFALTTVGVFLAHPISGLLFGPSLVVIALALALGRDRRDWDWLLRLAIAGGAAALLATPYWHPLVTMQKSVNLQAAAGGYFDPVLHTVHWHQLFGGPWGFAGSLAGSDKDQMSFQLGNLQLGAALTGAVIGWSNRFVRGVMVALVISIVAMTPTATGLWRLPVFAQMQFPWRLLSVTVGLQAALLIGWAQNPPALLQTSRARAAVVLGLLLLTLGWRPEQFKIRAPQPGAAAKVAAMVAGAPASPEPFAARNEFLPITARRPPPPRGNRPLVETAPAVPITPLPEHNSHHIAAQIEVKAPVTVVINQLYFPGWSVKVDGTALPRPALEAALQDDGRIRVPLTPAGGPVQTVTARYAAPPGQLIRVVGFALGCALLVLLGYLDRRRAPAAAVASV